MIFFIVIAALILWIYLAKIQNNHAEKHTTLETYFIDLPKTSLIRPTYVIADFFDILQYNLFTSGNEIRNLKLAYERLKHDYAQLKIENEHLANITQYRPEKSKIIATGRIISASNSLSAGVFMISVGKKDGVLFQDIVVNEQGFVGKVVKVSTHHSIVMPLRHLSAKTMGRVRNQGSLALMTGRHFKGAVINYLSDGVGLKAGQEVYTISDAEKMPAGLKIGHIIDPYDRPIYVKLAVDFKKLNYVTVIRAINYKASYYNIIYDPLYWALPESQFINYTVVNYD